MKRIFYLLLALCLMLAPLAGCTDVQTPDDPTPDEQPPVEETPETPEDPEPEKEEVKAPMTLKIGSFNIGNGAYVGHDLSVLANDITSQELDIVGLQEVDRLANRSKNLDTLKVLSELTGMEYYYFAKAIDLPGNIPTYGQDGEYGIGILSKYPITESESYPLESGSREQRMLARATIDLGGKTVNFFTTHLSFEDDKIRAGQISQIDGIMWEYSRCILTGDFNLRAFSELEEIAGVDLVNNDDNVIETYTKDDWNTKSIDNICYSSAYELVDSYANVNDHSDHYMLVAEFKIK
ncbi:MAG: endonuclease/exonuclease/phosphatase family protein [Clostridia bacterium]|nr:endonuclease/exonuclease/phosphatase family protein [Clostridia bacterium]